MRRPVLLSLIFGVLVLVGFGVWYLSYLGSASPGTGDVVVTIPKGTGVRGIGHILGKEGLVPDDVRFLCMAFFSGKSGKLKAGEYSIPRGLTPPAVLKLLIEGVTLRHHITVPEGLTMEEIADIFARDGWIHKDRFLQLAHDQNFIHHLGLDVPDLEGYLFPETYTLARNEADEAAVLRLMVGRFNTVWKELGAPEKAEGLDSRQLLILASMVEKETGASQERPLVARVFLNRLQRRMRLQSDPTVIYGIPHFNGNLTRADLQRPSPYNTYVIPALPAGPICNPGRAALEAVLHPADSSALYFVSRKDGTHQFSNNLDDHIRAVRQYQLNR